jgi:hypothetical protein
MKADKGFEKMSDLFNKRAVKKPPAYQWQDLALRIIKELNIPLNKKGSVFKVCKTEPRNFIETCLNDTKELCQTGEKWKYFFKLVNKEKL